MRSDLFIVLAIAQAVVSPQSHAYALVPLERAGEYLKWGESFAAGTTGGVVTWGFVAPGTAGSEVCLPYCSGKSAAYLPNFYPTPATSNQIEPLPLLSLREAFQAAFDAWSAVADIHFRYVGVDHSLLALNDPAAESPMIRIAIFSFDGQWKFCNAGSAFAPPPNVGTIAGDIFINSNVGYQLARAPEDEQLDYPNPAGLYMTDLHHLALHETGHAIGLGSSEDADSAMCGQSLSMVCNRLSSAWRRPRADDAAGVQFLYGPPPGVARAPNPSLERPSAGKTLGPLNAVVHAAPCGSNASPAGPVRLKP